MLSSLDGKIQNIPTRRTRLYSEVGISREHGALLCNLLGFGTTRPLEPFEVDRFKRYVATLKEWQKQGNGIKTFIKHCQEKGKLQNEKLNT